MIRKMAANKVEPSQTKSRNRLRIVAILGNKKEPEVNQHAAID